MQFNDVLTQLNTLPTTFTRPGSQFAELQASKAAGLFRYTNASDGLMEQASSFVNASGPWLDAWGRLFGVVRDPDETDAAYQNRITAVLTTGCGTPVAIVLYILVALGIQATVTEDFNDTSWSLSLSTPLSPMAFQQLISNLIYVRPAGVPFVKVQTSEAGGTFLGTINYLGAPRVTGAYLKTPQQTTDTTALAAFTNNSVPLLPSTFLTDPTLNPGLATG